MIEQHELDAWMGEAKNEATPEQRHQIQQAADRATERYPDDPEMQQAALAGAAQYILGDSTLVDLGAQRRRTKQEELRAYAAAEAAAVTAVESGAYSQYTAAQAAGIDRMSVRRGLGLR